jgi:lipopolysaccharide transport system ATP-binding protein
MQQTIKVENLSKRYRLGAAKSNSLRDALVGMLKMPRRGAHRPELWALRDVSFTVNEGETLGIIGQNGAGKSTLLKILSRITKPSSGRALLHGRVGSLLEVGTGFHSELSGRENIYMSGAIMGMRNREIEQKFDEIVAFSEVEKFLDTPVKHYSSGMFMRLAFSVAAHLEPEILIVDEVLAVGDITFQKKSLNKMRDVSQSGRTVLFVSHSMNSITRLCDRVIWMRDGEIVKDGEAGQVVSDYLHEQSQTGAEKSWNDMGTAPGNEIVKLRNIRITDDAGKTVSSTDIRRKAGVEMTYEVTSEGTVLVPNFHFYNEEGVCIFISHDWNGGWRSKPRPKGVYTSTAWIPENFLAEGAVFVTAAIGTYEPFAVHYIERDVIAFNVVDSLEGDSARGDYAGVLPGVVRPVLHWETSTSK